MDATVKGNAGTEPERGASCRFAFLGGGLSPHSIKRNRMARDVTAKPLKIIHVTIPGICDAVFFETNRT